MSYPPNRGRREREEPVGYQTNRFVYGPGQYEFRDFVRVGGPLQVLLAVVTTVGIAAFWGL
ncbi:hypothetical protein SAMN05216388_1004224 [Halorientalis persicus]|uniref:Uncharacterized protein n=1 Tax=Halorientalis persicus TaxID=1367881 RepID=A0A1H8IPA9_9EURY|nr:hypothetical protein [Halorientalis persicus]SEN70249.1 hypothetical protein SAMN05216388_1004224 [Halorientalis persicus]